MTQISKQALIVENNQSFPNNNNGAITPSELRGFNVDMIDSTVNQTVYTTDSGSWNQQINALKAFTSSQQPSFTALNSFTASQLVINSGVNTYTQSANARLSALENETANLETFTSSINQILSNGTLLGLSTRFNLVGPGTFFSASIVQNVGGPIATLTFTSDNAKLNTSSFNDYTASTAATQSLFSASVATSISQSSAAFTAFSSSQNSFNLSATASIVQLLNFSSSLDAGFVSEAEFGQYTQSINSFTSSGVFGLGFATTGSNSFNGNQTITGSVSLSGSSEFDLTITGRQLITGPITGTTPQLLISGSDFNNRIGRSTAYINKAGRNFGSGYAYGRLDAFANPNEAAIINLGVFDEPNFVTDIELLVQVDTGSGIQFQDLRNDTYDYSTWMSIAPNTGNNPDVVFKRSVDISGSLDIVGNQRITGSVTITGSVYGNVRGITISSNTASIDLSVSNFFTLTLVSGSTTHLTATNIRPGQTINLLVAQPSVGTGSVSYSTSIFDFPAGANYIPTPITGSKDIISFISFDSSILYATSINNLA